MKIQYFKVTLLEEVVISERAATEGGHRSLSYLPGSTFLGAVAAHLYQALGENAYTVFHSGKVRFSHALPLSKEAQLTYPMPLCCYKKKGQPCPPPKNGEITLKNYQHSKHPDKKDIPEQMRDCFVSLGAKQEENRFTQIKPEFRMKTAIDRDLGIAREQQLFGYRSLPTGQEFVFCLEADAEIESTLFEQVIKILQQNDLRLGNSRSAEYGAVQLEPIESSEQLDERDSPKAASEVTLWLLADAALQNELGHPLLSPTATSVGLPSHFKLNLAKTFIRSRRYAPFNAHRYYREVERVVLNMGSVLHFDCQDENGKHIPCDKVVDAECLQRIQNQGIGLYRQTGLGRVWINPAFLQSKSPDFGKPKKFSFQKPISECKEPDHLVLRYLQQRRGEISNTKAIEKQANEWENELKLLYDSANKLSSGMGLLGPTKTQWGRVMEAANEIAKSPPKGTTPYKALTKKLFIGEHAVCKKLDEQWAKRVFYEERGADKDKPKKSVYNFRRWLLYKLYNCEEESNKCTELRNWRIQVMARFAILARRIVEEQNKGNSK